jgi:small basic protein (TIGR04137 family)
MSVDRSLKVKGALSRHRNVLSRGERIEKLKDEEKWAEGQSVFALPKVAHRKSHAGRKAAKAEEKPAEAEVTVEGTTPAAEAEEKKEQ